MIKASTVFALSLICVFLTLPAAQCLSGDPAEKDLAVLNNLVKSIEINDYESYMADASTAFRSSFTKSMLQNISVHVSPRLKNGYTCSYLGELSQKGCKITLWKLSFKDGGDDTLVRLVIKDGKVINFLLQ